MHIFMGKYNLTTLSRVCRYCSLIIGGRESPSPQRAFLRGMAARRRRMDATSGDAGLLQVFMTYGMIFVTKIRF